MKYYCITGRVPGDDEDRMMCLGPADSKEEAMGWFTQGVVEAEGLSAEDVERLFDEYGTAVFINSIVSSDSPLGDET